MSPTVYHQGQAFHITTDMVLSVLYSSANRWLEQGRHVCVCVNLITVCHRDKCSILALKRHNNSIHGCNGFQTLQIRDQRERDRARGKTKTEGGKGRQGNKDRGTRKSHNMEREEEVERKLRMVHQEDIMFEVKWKYRKGKWKEALGEKERGVGPGVCWLSLLSSEAKFSH